MMWMQLAGGGAEVCKRLVDLDYQCLKDMRRLEASNVSSIQYFGQSWCIHYGGQQGPFTKDEDIEALGRFRVVHVFKLVYEP